MEHAHWHLVMVLSLLVGLIALPAWGDEPAAIQRGKAVLQAAGGCSCHTDDKHSGAFLAGGRPIKTPFGTIYSTNITPAPKTGIGTWSEADFRRAMTQGVGPDGRHYFPVFPYTSFTRMTEQDVQDPESLFVLCTTRGAGQQTAGVAVSFWLACRSASVEVAELSPWHVSASVGSVSGVESWRVSHHCARPLCRMPHATQLARGLKTKMAYAGSADGPEGELAPNITPDEATGIGKWSVADIVWFLQTGLKPDGDDTQGLMSVVIENGYKHLPEADLRAIAVYLRSLSPIRNKVVKKDK